MISRSLAVTSACVLEIVVVVAANEAWDELADVVATLSSRPVTSKATTVIATAITAPRRRKRRDVLAVVSELRCSSFDILPLLVRAGW
jgi:hypothetical protein